MHIDYDNLEEVLASEMKVGVFDLLRHVPQMEPKLFSKLIYAPKGVYLVGNVDPIVDSSKKYCVKGETCVTPENIVYYVHHQLEIYNEKEELVIGVQMPEPGKKSWSIHDAYKRIKNFKFPKNGSLHVKPYSILPLLPCQDPIQALKEGRDIHLANGELMVKAKDYITKQRHLREFPTVPSVGIKVAYAVVLDYLIEVCHPKSIQFKPICIDDYVLAISPSVELFPSAVEYREELVTVHQKVKETVDELNHAFPKLLTEITEYIGPDTNNIYIPRLRGTSLILEKSVDYRIYEYYRMLFEQREKLHEYEETHGASLFSRPT